MSEDAIWALIRVGAAFAVILLGIRFKLGQGLALLAGGLSLALLFSINPLDWLKTTLMTFIEPGFLSMAAIVLTIFTLSETMERTQQNFRLVHELEGRLTWPRFRLVFFPALVGLFPMPGGAIFSCPMVQETSRNMGLTSEQKVLINYWFRHLWDASWPLYPGIVLACYLSDISLLELPVYTWPTVLIYFVIGWFFFVRALKDVTANLPVEEKSTYKALFWEALPLLLGFAGAMLLTVALSRYAPQIPPEIAFIAAFVVAIATCLGQNRQSPVILKKIIVSKKMGQMLFLIFGIFVFKNIIGQSGAINMMVDAVDNVWALLAVFTALPFLAGLLTGVMVGIVGASFPIIMGLLEGLGLWEYRIPFVVLALMCGNAGQMASPVHVCFLITCEYFHEELPNVWKKMIVPGLVLIATALLYYVALWVLLF